MTKEKLILVIAVTVMYVYIVFLSVPKYG